MKAIRIHAYGKAEQLKLEETGLPKLKAGEVLVKIRDAGVNPVDWKIREGQLKEFIHARFPYTMGQDFSGEVVEVGEAVKDFKIGDKVFGFARGSYAEYANVSITKIARKPESINDVTAAALPTAGLTAWQLVTEVTRIAMGQKLLIHGACGGVGSFAVQIAKWRGARVFATASKKDEAYLKELGVERVIDYKIQRFEEHLRDLDAVIDLVGGDTLERSLQVLKKGGVLATVVGEIPESEAKRYGVSGVEFTMRQDSSGLAELAKLVDRGIIKPRVSRVLALREAKTAQELNETGQSHGKIILKVA